MSTDVPFVRNETKTDWAAIRGEASIYLLVIVAGVLAYIFWEDAKLRREEIEVVKRVHVQLDAYAFVTGKALEKLEPIPPLPEDNSRTHE